MIPLKVKEHRTTCRNIPATFRHATKRTNPSQRSRTIARLCASGKNVHEKSIVCSTQKLPERAKGELRNPSRRSGLWCRLLPIIVFYNQPVF